MGTNFLPLPSGGFTGLRPKQQPAPSHNFLPYKNDISACNFDQRFFLLTEMSFYTDTVYTKPIAAPRPSYLRIFYAHFIALRLFQPQDFLKGIRLLIIANHPVTVRSGRSLGVLMVGFFLLTKQTRGGVL